MESRQKDEIPSSRQKDSGSGRSTKILSKSGIKRVKKLCDHKFEIGQLKAAKK